MLEENKELAKMQAVQENIYPFLGQNFVALEKLHTLLVRKTKKQHTASLVPDRERSLNLCTQQQTRTKRHVN